MSHRETRRRAGLLPTLALLALGATAAAGCSDKPEAAPASAAKKAAPAAPAPGLQAGDTVPAPKGKTVLSFSGRTGTHNAGRELRFDLVTLQKLGMRTVELYEPFKKRRMRFRAVPMRNLVDVVSPRAGAKKLHTVALNDYAADVPLDIARAEGTYLALRNGDGSRIGVAEGGPIRIVFLDGAKGGEIHNYWTWSLASIDVR